MAEKIRAALLQNGQATYTPALQQELRAQAVEIQSAESCRDIHALLASPNPPELVLTDLRLSDSTWKYFREGLSISLLRLSSRRNSRTSCARRLATLRNSARLCLTTPSMVEQKRFFHSSPLLVDDLPAQSQPVREALLVQHPLGIPSASR